MKKGSILVAILVCFAMLLPFDVRAESDNRVGKFKDVSDRHWAKAMIEQAVEKGYVSGYQDGTFRPDKNITRAEVASILDRVTNLKTGANPIVLPDMDKHWSKESVRRLISMGVISAADYSKGFEPDKPITRYELMKWMASGLAQSDSTMAQALKDTKDTLLPTPESFTGAIKKEQVPYIALVRGTGIVNGYTDGSFKTSEKATRAEVLTMMLSYAKVEGTKANNYSDLQEMIEVSLEGMNSGLIKEMVFDNETRFKDIADKTFDFKYSDIKLHRIIFVDGRTSEYKGIYAPLFIGTKKNDLPGYVVALTNMTFTYQEDKPYKGALSQEVTAEMRNISNILDLQRIDWENAKKKHIPTLPITNVNIFVLPNKPVNIWVESRMKPDMSYYIQFGKKELSLTTLTNRLKVVNQ